MGAHCTVPEARGSHTASPAGRYVSRLGNLYWKVSAGRVFCLPLCVCFRGVAVVMVLSILPNFPILLGVNSGTGLCQMLVISRRAVARNGRL